MASWRTRFHDKWPHLTSLYASTNQLDEDGKYVDPMIGYDNVFDPAEPYGAYRFYMAPREEMVLQTDPHVYNKSIYKNDDEERTYTSGDSFRRGSTCRVLLCVFLVISLIGVVTAATILAVILSKTPMPKPEVDIKTDNFESTVKITNGTFTDELKDRNNQAFKDLEQSLCDALEAIYTGNDSPIKDIFDGCEVIEFTNGSINARFRIKLRYNQNVEYVTSLINELKSHLVAKIPETGPWTVLQLQSLTDFVLAGSGEITTTTPTTSAATTIKSTTTTEISTPARNITESVTQQLPSTDSIASSFPSVSVKSSSTPASVKTSLSSVTSKFDSLSTEIRETTRVSPTLTTASDISLFIQSSEVMEATPSSVIAETTTSSTITDSSSISSIVGDVSTSSELKGTTTATSDTSVSSSEAGITESSIIIKPTEATVPSVIAEKTTFSTITDASISFIDGDVSTSSQFKGTTTATSDMLVSSSEAGVLESSIIIKPSASSAIADKVSSPVTDVLTASKEVDISTLSKTQEIVTSSAIIDTLMSSIEVDTSTLSAVTSTTALSSITDKSLSSVEGSIPKSSVLTEATPSTFEISTSSMEADVLTSSMVTEPSTSSVTTDSTTLSSVTDAFVSSIETGMLTSSIMQETVKSSAVIEASLSSLEVDTSKLSVMTEITTSSMVFDASMSSVYVDTTASSMNTEKELSTDIYTELSSLEAGTTVSSVETEPRSSVLLSSFDSQSTESLSPIYQSVTSLTLDSSLDISNVPGSDLGSKSTRHTISATSSVSSYQETSVSIPMIYSSISSPTTQVTEHSLLDSTDDGMRSDINTILQPTSVTKASLTVDVATTVGISSETVLSDMSLSLDSAVELSITTSQSVSESSSTSDVYLESSVESSMTIFPSTSVPSPTSSVFVIVDSESDILSDISSAISVDGYSMISQIESKTEASELISPSDFEFSSDVSLEIITGTQTVTQIVTGRSDTLVFSSSVQAPVESDGSISSVQNTTAVFGSSISQTLSPSSSFPFIFHSSIESSNQINTDSVIYVTGDIQLKSSSYSDTVDILESSTSTEVTSSLQISSHITIDSSTMQSTGGLPSFPPETISGAVTLQTYTTLHSTTLTDSNDTKFSTASQSLMASETSELQSSINASSRMISLSSLNSSVSMTDEGSSLQSSTESFELESLTSTSYQVMPSSFMGLESRVPETSTLSALGMTSLSLEAADSLASERLSSDEALSIQTFTPEAGAISASINVFVSDTNIELTTKGILSPTLVIQSSDIQQISDTLSVIQSSGFVTLQETFVFESSGIQEVSGPLSVMQSSDLLQSSKDEFESTTAAMTPTFQIISPTLVSSVLQQTSETSSVTQSTVALDSSKYIFESSKITYSSSQQVLIPSLGNSEAQQTLSGIPSSIAPLASKQSSSRNISPLSITASTTATILTSASQELSSQKSDSVVESAYLPSVTYVGSDIPLYSTFQSGVLAETQSTYVSSKVSENAAYLISSTLSPVQSESVSVTSESKADTLSSTAAIVSSDTLSVDSAIYSTAVTSLQSSVVSLSSTAAIVSNDTLSVDFPTAVTSLQSSVDELSFSPYYSLSTGYGINVSGTINDMSSTLLDTPVTLSVFADPSSLATVFNSVGDLALSFSNIMSTHGSSLSAYNLESAVVTTPLVSAMLLESIRVSVSVSSAAAPGELVISSFVSAQNFSTTDGYITSDSQQMTQASTVNPTTLPITDSVQEMSSVNSTMHITTSTYDVFSTSLYNTPVISTSPIQNISQDVNETVHITSDYLLSSQDINVTAVKLSTSSFITPMSVLNNSLMSSYTSTNSSEIVVSSSYNDTSYIVTQLSMNSEMTGMSFSVAPKATFSDVVSNMSSTEALSQSTSVLSPSNSETLSSTDALFSSDYLKRFDSISVSLQSLSLEATPIVDMSSVSTEYLSLSVNSTLP